MLQGDPSSEEVLKFLEEGEKGVGGGNAIRRQTVEEVPREEDLFFR